MLKCRACGECFKDVFDPSKHRREVHGVSYVSDGRRRSGEGEEMGDGLDV